MTRTARLGALTVAATAAAVTLLTGPAAYAEPDPCGASVIARTVGDVATDAADYLGEDTDTDTALSYAARQPPAQAAVYVKSYFDANPTAAAELQRIQQPLVVLSTRCRLPVTLPQVLALAGNVPALSSPGAALGVPGATVPGAAESSAGALSGAASPGVGAPAVTPNPSSPSAGLR